MAIETGYHQTTLTNFERKFFQGDLRSYIYEMRSFETNRHNMIGFGPSGIFYSSTGPRGFGLKTMNPESSIEYLQAAAKKEPFWNRYFKFDTESQRLLYITRQLSKMSVDRSRYRDLFGTDIISDYPNEMTALAQSHLVEVDESSIRLSVRGMFFSDTIASVLAYGRDSRKLGRESAEQVSSKGNEGGFM